LIIALDIKKVGPLKFIHRKWKDKDAEEERARFLSEFNTAIQYNEELASHVSKAQDGLFSSFQIFFVFQKMK
jgi:hypothetical protein